MVPTVFTHVRSLNTLEQNHKVTNCTSMTRVTLKAKITSIKTFFVGMLARGLLVYLNGGKFKHA